MTSTVAPEKHGKQRKNGAPVTSVYARPAEDGSSLLDQLDFSQAFKTTHLGNALCHSNPMQEKYLEKRVADTERQQRRMGNALYHSQRTFFITQVFEKGLNPYLKKAGREAQKQHSQSAHTPRERVHYDPKDNQGGHYDSQTRNRTERPQTEHTRKQKETENLPVLRSKTLIDIKPSKKSVQIWDYATKPEQEHEEMAKNTASQHKPLPTLKDKTKRPKAEVVIVSSAKVRSAKSATKLPKLSEEDDDDSFEFSHAGTTPEPEANAGAADSVDVFELSMNNGEPTRSQRRDLAYLKKNPTMLFPKMNKLIVKDMLGGNEPFSIDEHARAPRDKRFSQISLRASGEPTQAKPKPKPISPLKSTPETTSADYVKLIQKLTTYLPEHLADTAREQIREMTQSDAIQEQKEKILSHNRTKLSREASIGDRRWEKLEKSLSANYGLNQKWKRVQATGAWIKVPPV